ncbi:MAG: serine hydrolase [Marinilabiliales bacterium]|nr:serine hydrolase [Marinilabiliales bacterium]
MRKFLILLLFVCIGLPGMSQVDLEKLSHHPWVDSVYQSMTTEQRVAQLIWIDVTAGNNLQKQLRDAQLVRDYGFGGIIFFEGDPVTQTRLTNLYRSLSKIQPIVAMDAEWGIGMRLSSVLSMPYNMAMGAAGDTSLVRQAASEMARQMRRIGVNLSLGPCCDINTEPLNPVIGMRSFGESAKAVTRYSVVMAAGLQQNGILATAKHFPGHGDTRTDSHLALPTLPFTRERLDTLEMVPFRELANAGIGCIMTGHLNLPALDATPGEPSSLSPKIVGEILFGNWHYKGLVITDATNMEGAMGFLPPGKLEVAALKAGNDVVEFPADPVLAYQEILLAVQKKELPVADLERKCRKVLAAKYWCGLDHPVKIQEENLLRELNKPNTELIKRKITEKALTVLENRDSLLPVRNLDKIRIASLSVGSETMTPFQKMLGNYCRIDPYQLPDHFSDQERRVVEKKLMSYDLVIAGLHALYENKGRRSMQAGYKQSGKPERPYGMNAGLDSLFNFLAAKKEAVMVVFGSPYSLMEWKSPKLPTGLILAYQNDSLNQQLAAQLIFGGISATGKLPVSLPGHYHWGDGLTTIPAIRLKYTLPEESGISSDALNGQIDSIVQEALAAKAFPGCNVLVAKDGKVIFHKAYGFHTFDRKVAESRDDLYDLASMTKITAGTPVWMKLFDEGKIQPDAFVSDYFPYWKNRLFNKTELKDVTIRELLSHQSGLPPFLPFWKKSMEKGVLSTKWYRFQQEPNFGLQAAKGLWLRNDFPQTVYKTIRKSHLKTRGKYVYSDLPFVMTPAITEAISGRKFRELLDESFYKPLGADRVTFLPLERFSEEEIIPTEKDHYYRQQQLLGTVHDESSAVLGGLSGNAGLFGSANDLAKIYEMYRRMGTYGGHQYLKESTLREFTRPQFPKTGNRRGLGFDKPLLNNDAMGEKEAYPIRAVSPESFGHSGYTGTFVWIDPACGLVYIFLSNRVYPTRDNNKIGEMNVRTEILKSIYQNMPKKEVR